MGEEGGWGAHTEQRLTAKHASLRSTPNQHMQANVAGTPTPSPPLISLGASGAGAPAPHALPCLPPSVPLSLEHTHPPTAPLSLDKLPPLPQLRLHWHAAHHPRRARHHRLRIGRALPPHGSRLPPHRHRLSDAPPASRRRRPRNTLRTVSRAKGVHLLPVRIGSLQMILRSSRPCLHAHLFTPAAPHPPLHIGPFTSDSSPTPRPSRACSTPRLPALLFEPRQACTALPAPGPNPLFPPLLPPLKGSSTARPGWTCPRSSAARPPTSSSTRGQSWPPAPAGPLAPPCSSQLRRSTRSHPSQRRSACRWRDCSPPTRRASASRPPSSARRPGSPSPSRPGLVARLAGGEPRALDATGMRGGRGV